MYKCKKCELNIVKDEDDICDVCNKQGIHSYKETDSNKDFVEKVLLKFLLSLPFKNVEAFTKIEASKEIFELNIPLLVECKCNDSCEKEVIVGNSSVYRYYIKPYDINGKKYHICSQWGEYNKYSFTLLKELNNDNK